MDALIDITNNASSNLPNNLNNNGNEKLLLKQKIENSIMEDRLIIVSISIPMIECRNSIYVDDYEIDDENLYLNNANFELHINLNEIEIIYDNSFEDSFTFIYNDTEINLHFPE